ncbi:MAG: hypothetical protein Q4C81_06190 [Kocuria sp.]|nr:hypothetical protein [Kocuria sp.]
MAGSALTGLVTMTPGAESADSVGPRATVVRVPLTNMDPASTVAAAAFLDLLNKVMVCSYINKTDG